MVIYAPGAARFRPQVYTHIFIGCDVVALVLQAVGGAVASTAPQGDKATLDAGIDTMVAGVSWQVFSLALFAALSVEFWVRVRRVSSGGRNTTAVLNPSFADLRARRAFNPLFSVALALAGVFIFVRSVFRCAELSAGYNGPLANDEVTFMVLEGAMITLACLLLTTFHPGLVVGTEGWRAASWKAGKRGAPSTGGGAEEAGKEMASASASDREY